MGSWNGTCAISNLHIGYGQDVAVIMLAKKPIPEEDFCYVNSLYDVCLIPFYGTYNDYGGVDDCHGFGMNIVVEAIREKLYQFGQGINTAHDIEVNKENFNIDMLFEADLENRLGIEYFNAWDPDEYNFRELERESQEGSLTDSQRFELDRLANKIKKKDAFRRVTHVIIHGDIFRSICNNWYLESYVGGGKGNAGYGNNYKHIYFKDLIESIPEYIDRVKANNDFSWNDSCLAGKWMNDACRDSRQNQSIISLDSIIEMFIEKKDWEGFASIAQEVLTGMWINSFMTHTRKIWTKQCGSGSQNGEPLGYKILANSILNVLKEEDENH